MINIWIIFWGIVLLFSLISFTLMSWKILFKSIGELKSMFQTLGKRQ